MRPIVFSHGLSGNKDVYKAVYLAMAAHGHLVVAINHQDRTCFHTYDKDKNEMYYELKQLYIAPLR